MQARIIPIGNSQGIRIPKTLLEQCHFEDAVELEVQEGALVLRPARRVRVGWSDQFRRMAEMGDDAPLDTPSRPLSAWDETEWEW